MRLVRGVVAATLLAIMATGCGGSDQKEGVASPGDDAERSADASTTTITSAPGAASAKGSAVTSTTAKAGSSSSAVGGATPKSQASTGDAPMGEPDGSELPSEPLPLAVELSSTCVRPGAPLTVTVKSAPLATIGYDTTWPDGKTGWDAPNRGGTAKGTTDDKGNWKNTSAVGADAPEGSAKMDVIGADVTGRTGRSTVEFKVSNALGKCS